MTTQTTSDLLQEIANLKKQLKRRYGLVREDKPEQFEEQAKNALPILKQQAELSIQEDPTKPQNIIIQGDNYHSLSALSYTHKSKIDVIYIDPPYNTGNKDFIYNDSFVDKEDTYRHSKWLSFMHKRLRLAKDLLSDEGVIFISIDDNEFSQLKLICDEVFGEKNFVDCICWDKKSSPKGVPPKNMIINVHEYILTYQKSDKFSFIGEPRKLDGFLNPDNDSRGPWRNTNIKSTIKTKEDAFEIINPDTGDKFVDTWAFSKEELDRLTKEKYLIFPKSPNGQVRRKEFYNEFKNSNIPVKSSRGLFDNQKNTEMLKAMFGGLVFQNPKPLNIIKYLLTIVSSKNSTILDFFAGSGTTGHAVLELNKQDGGNRQFILCSNTESTPENPDKNICKDITYERNKRIIQGYTNAKGQKIEGLGGNLRYYITEFIPITPSTDDLRYKFINLCDDLLCIKENTFTPISLTKSDPMSSFVPAPHETAGKEEERSEGGFVTQKEEQNNGGFETSPMSSFVKEGNPKGGGFSTQTGNSLKLYRNNSKHTAILYDIHHFDKLLDLLKTLNGQISVYTFSLNKEIYEEELAYLSGNITVQNIPDEILQAYKKIFNF